MNNRAFITHNDAGDEPLDITHVQLQGTIQATPAQLTAVFGRPIRHRGSKVQFQWQLEFSDTTEVATIYSWNEPYIEPTTSDVIVWRIGGRDRGIVERVHAAFREGFGLNARAA